MKRIFTLAIMLAFCQFSLTSQRYIEEIFDDVTVTSNVVYGQNPTILTLAVPGIEAITTEQLLMDVYQPAGDTETNRPAVVLLHTGNFLPAISNGQIAGQKIDSSAVEICTQLARRGFVAVSIDYRLGWQPLAMDEATRATTIIQASYRGIQDSRSAVRYLRKTVEEDQNLYGIDPDKIMAWGNGTGGYIVLGMASLDDYNEIITTTNGPGKFLLDLNGDQVPETPMVIPQYHGDIEGIATVLAPDSAFPPYMTGDTTTIGNHPGYSSDIQLSVNVGGAIGDISWLDENTPPMITVHGIYDQFAPYTDAVLEVPGQDLDVIRVQGGELIGQVQNELGNNDIFASGIFDDAVTQEAADNAAIAGHPYYEGLYSFLSPPNSLGFDEGVVINWWDPNDPAPGAGMGIPLNLLPYPDQVNFPGFTYHDQGQVLNEGMSAEKARGNIAKIMQYVMPRTCLALELPECDYLFTNTKDVIADDSFLSVSPNPVDTKINLRAGENIIQNVEVLSLDGQLIKRYNNINQNHFTVDRTNIPTGMYLIKTEFENGIATKKVVFK